MDRLFVDGVNVFIQYNRDKFNVSKRSGVSIQFNVSKRSGVSIQFNSIQFFKWKKKKEEERKTTPPRSNIIIGK